MFLYFISFRIYLFHSLLFNNFTIVLPFSLKASDLVPDDLEYKLLVAACYIRKEDFLPAMHVLQSVLTSAADNEKALFHYAFCLKSVKKEKEAIQCLTRVSTVCTFLLLTLQYTSFDQLHALYLHHICTILMLF